MGSRIAQALRSVFYIEKHERLKVFFLTCAFFFIIGGYTITKELKDSIFISVVGKDYLSYAKWLTMIVLTPALLLYSALVDRLRRYQLLCLYALIYGALGLVFTYLLGHPTIGLENTTPDPSRLLGWFFYLFVEGYQPFVVSIFWAFANSITTPDSAKKYYGIMVSGSKLGGVISAAFGWWVLSSATSSLFVSTDSSKHQLLLACASVLSLLVPVWIWGLIRNVSGKYLHGYEAVYQVEKQRTKEGASDTGVWAGLTMLIKYPYAFGMFCLVLFYEIIMAVLNYQRIGIAQEQSSNISDVSGFLFKIILVTHTLGFLISLFGTTPLLKRLGERRCLLLVPISTAILFVYFRIQSTQFAFLSMFVALRSIHYGFSYPVRESLYIPTVKEVKFKSKSWIDAFGTKFAKTTGWVFNHLARGLDMGAFITAQSFLFGSIIGLWMVTAYLIGRRFERAIANNEVIGLDSDETNSTTQTV
jgi:AAA family ATP:ADP antiporter